MDKVNTRKKKTAWGNVWFVESEDKSFRFAIYRYDDEPSVIYLSNVFVDPQHRNSGLGNSILNATDEIARRMNADLIYLKVKSGSFAEKWYKRHGYVDFESDENEPSFMWLRKEITPISINENKNFDVLYRGVEKGQRDGDVPVLWLTTSKDYAENFGDTILKYAVSLNVLNSLASEKEALNYLKVETDEYPFYETQYFDIEKMKGDGFSGYYYHEDEYKCLNVCLFDKQQAKLMLK